DQHAKIAERRFAVGAEDPLFLPGSAYRHDEPIGHEQLAHFQRLVQKAARTETQVENQAIEPLLLKVLHRRAHFGGSAALELLDVHIADLAFRTEQVLPAAVWAAEKARYRAQTDIAADNRYLLA